MSKLSKVILILCYIIICFTAAVAAGTVDPINHFSFSRTLIQEVICWAVIALCIIAVILIRKKEKRR